MTDYVGYALRVKAPHLFVYAVPQNVHKKLQAYMYVDILS